MSREFFEFEIWGVDHLGERIAEKIRILAVIEPEAHQVLENECGSVRLIPAPQNAVIAVIFSEGILHQDRALSIGAQGAIGYGKRFGLSFADGTSENFLVQAIFPSLFRQDPRYYQDGKGTFWRRAGYAVSRTAVTRNDSGQVRFNISEVAGAGVAAAISNTYHPATDRTVPNTIQTWATMMGWDTVSDVVKEFWPDIRRKVHQKKEIKNRRW